MSRAPDERFASLLDMQAFKQRIRNASNSSVLSSRALTVLPIEDDARGLRVTAKTEDSALIPTHWSFGQLCSLASPGNSPASYFRETRMPAPMIADCLNYNLRFNRGPEDIGLLATSRENGVELRSVNGPNYGRVYGADVVNALVDRFGDGVSGTWRVPGEFGVKVTVDKGNTTLYASDRDMFVFLADEENRIELPNRRAGRMGSFARGFFVGNSEVGKSSLFAGFFLFDYVCCNRIIWGADQYTEVRIRHTKGAPDRWLEEVTPVLQEYAEGSAKPVVQAIEDARSKRIDDDLTAFLSKRFGKQMAPAIAAIHETEEGRPIETLWDVIVAAPTAASTGLSSSSSRAVSGFASTIIFASSARPVSASRGWLAPSATRPAARASRCSTSAPRACSPILPRRAAKVGCRG
jgi:hypothetical protein